MKWLFLIYVLFLSFGALAQTASQRWNCSTPWGLVIQVQKPNTCTYCRVQMINGSAPMGIMPEAQGRRTVYKTGRFDVTVFESYGQSQCRDGHLGILQRPTNGEAPLCCRNRPDDLPFH